MEKLSENIDFENIVRLIEEARNHAFAKVNAELVKLYFDVGEIVSAKAEAGNWGEKTVDELAEFISRKMPETKGFTRRGLYRMKQFYESYNEHSECFKTWIELKSNASKEIVSAVPTQLQTQQTEELQGFFLSQILAKISWTNHRLIFSKTKTNEEKLYYLNLVISESLTSRDLEPALIADYETKLIDKDLLARKLLEFTEILGISGDESEDE